ncbi:MAG: DnaJ domain-containing protein [Bacteroidota bacterium]
MSLEPDHYSTLGIDGNATDSEIKEAYRELAKKYHPDKSGGDLAKEEVFKRITNAYNVLSDQRKRSNYDYRRSYQQLVKKQQEEEQARARTFYKKLSKPIYFFSIRTKILGAFFVLMLIAAAVAIPFGLEIYSSEKYYDQGIKALKAGNYELASKNFKYSLKEMGLRNKELAKRISIISIYELHEHSTALNFTQIGLNESHKASDLYQFHFLRGLALKKLKNYDVSMKHFQKSIFYNPQCDSAIYHIAEMQLYHFRDYDKAQDYFRQLFQINKDFSDAYYGLAYTHYVKEEYYQSLYFVKKFLKEYPNEGAALHLRGMCNLHLKNNDEACVFLRKASEKGYSSGNPIVNLYCGIK